MAQDDRRADGDRSEQRSGEDYQYYGPFGAPPTSDDAARTAPLGIGHWSYVEDDPTRELPPVSAAGPTGGGSASPGSGRPSSPSLFPAPAGVQPLRPRPVESIALPYATAPSRKRRSARLGTVLLLAGLMALVIGGGAGYAGARFAARTGASPQPSLVPSSSGPILVPSSPPTAPPSPPAPPSTPYVPPSGQANTVGVAKRVLPSTVMIQVGTATTGGTGSGIVLDDQGHILTNNHVVMAAGEGGRIRVVFLDGTHQSGTLVGRSPSYDLAVVKVDRSASLVPIQIGNSDTAQVGESVIAVGAPLALPGTVTAGIVSAKNRPVVVANSENADAPSAYINAIQTDAPINPGNSGGPLVDPQARVIGVNSAILTLGQTAGQSGSIGLGFAIPINQAMQVGQQLLTKGKATYPVIGANVSSETLDQGVRLSSVEASGPAAASGLRAGDLITTLDGAPVTDTQELIVTIRTHRPGERISFGFVRGGVREKTIVVLGGKEG